MKKILCLLIIVPVFLLLGCYDASEVEETAYLIALGIDNAENGTFNYTFQFAAPLAISGGEEGGGGGGSDSQPKKEGEILDAKNPTVKNIVISAQDFYAAKNILTNYLSKTVNMSHLKMIVCSEAFAKDGLKKHTQLFLEEREIRPGTFMAISEDKAEQFLKAVKPDLEGSTSKYYELSNSEKTLVFAPSVRLGDFVSKALAFDKSSVLPIAVVDKEKLATALYGMGVFKDSVLIGKMNGDEALLFNVLSGTEKRFSFSVNDPKNNGERLSFDNSLLENPEFKIEENGDALKITTEIYLDMEFIGAKLPDGYKSEDEVLALGENELKSKLANFMLKTARDFSADILSIERFYKNKFFTTDELENAKFREKYKNAEFLTLIKRSNKGGSSISGEIN